MALIRVYGYKTPPGPISQEQLTDNELDEQVQVEPTPDARALELQAFYGWTPARGINTIDTDPRPPAHTYTVLDSAVAAADAAIADEGLDAAALRAALVALRGSLVPAG